MRRIAQAGLAGILTLGAAVGGAQALSPVQAGAGSFPNAAERTLLTHISSSFRSSCVRSTPANVAPRSTASVFCRPPGGVSVYYESFGSRGTALGYYDSVLRQQRIARLTRGDCARGQRMEGTWSRQTGRVVCFKESGRAFQVWTHTRLRIVTTGIRRDGSSARLHTFFLSAASGPS